MSADMELHFSYFSAKLFGEVNKKLILQYDASNE